MIKCRYCKRSLPNKNFKLKGKCIWCSVKYWFGDWKIPSNDKGFKSYNRYWFPQRKE